MARRMGAVVLAVLLLAGQVTAVLAASAPPGGAGSGPLAAPVQSGLIEQLERGAATRFVVEFNGKADLSGAARLTGKAAKGGFVIDALSATAGRAQREAAAAAAGIRGVRFTTYWLTNVAVVEVAPGNGKAGAALAARLASVAGVSAIRAEKIYPLVEPVNGSTPAVPLAEGDGIAPEWGVEKIGAPAAWAQGVTGSGIVVANIDTGVDYLHEALTNQYRGKLPAGGFDHDFSWFDPTGICGDEPCDNAQHGTHTMGTIVGGDGEGPYVPDTGVAPGASWIAAKGCEDFGCSEQALLASGQWMLAPTPVGSDEGDPAKAPDVLNNSWGSGPGDTFYLETVQAWRVAGIIPVFSSGNPGPACGDGGSPGDFAEALSVGATDDEDLIADFSGRGPSNFKDHNPDVTAPGVDVTSTIPGGGFASFSGTSMAAPHTTGTLALMLQADADLRGNFDGATGFLKQTALDIPDDSCGGPDESDDDPNNVYGEGRINAALAVDTVKNGGTLAGIVVDAESANSNPIAGARVVASADGRNFPTTTGEDGTYSMLLSPGDYTVSATSFGYAGQVAGPVTIATDTTTTQNFSLEPLPRFTVSGQVTAAENGDPLEGVKVAVLGTPVTPVLTNPNGVYAVELPIGTYDLRFTARGCAESLTVEDVTGTFEGDDQTANASLVQKLDGFGHGCRAIDQDWVDAAGQSALWGDEIGGRLKLPFSFPFYGETYDEIWIAENGYFNFLDFDAGNFVPVALPSGSLPNAAVYPLWQDLWILEGGIDSQLIGDAPDRAFVVEYGVELFGTDTAVEVEVKLWEDGTIDFLYGNNPATADGRNATVGIENADGSDALQITHLEGVIEDDSALRIETVPTGLVAGAVTDANDGMPVVGATVTAQPGNRTARTDDAGNYQLRLRPGVYTVTISAAGYVSQSTPGIGISVDETDTLDAALEAPTAAASPLAIDAILDFGETDSFDVTLTNDGSAPLTWEAKERSVGSTPVPLPEPGIQARRTPAWRAQVLPPGVTVSPITPAAIGDLPLVVSDPDDDSLGNLELIAIRGFSDGTAANIGLEYAPGSNVAENGGFVYLDVDQDPSTGAPPVDFFGLPSQDIGLDYWAELFSLGGSEPVVTIFSVETFELVAEVPAEVTADGVTFGIPLEALGGDDGLIDVALVTGLFGPEDWAPDEGHGTIESFSDLPWLAADPAAGSTAGPGQTVVSVTVGSADLEPGTHEAQLVFLTDAPRSRFVTVDVTAEVGLPAEFGAATGVVSDAHGGFPIEDAAVVLTAEWPAGTTREFTATTDADGAYRIVGPAGTWPTTVTAPGYEPATIEATIASGVTTSGADAALHLDAPHAELSGGDVEAIVGVGGVWHGTLTLGNPGGHEPLDFEINEVDLAGAGVTSTSGTLGRRTLPAGADPNARTARGLFTGDQVNVPPGVLDTVGVLAEWPTEGVVLPWGVGFDGNVYISDPLAGSEPCGASDDCINARYSPAGEPGPIVPADWAGDWNADMAYDPGRGLIWQVNVGGDNGIVGWDRDTGEAVETITGDPWSDISQRGLAYDAVNDVFYVGGWNEGVIYRIAGLSSATPGEVLNECTPDDPAISGLAWNPSFELLWAATNSDTDSIYLLDPTTCEAQNVLAHPAGGGFNGAGLEMDAVGNLWTVGQNLGTAYLLESGLPNFSDAEWLSVQPVDGTVAPDGTTDLAITLDASGLDVGVHRALLVVGTNDPDNRYITRQVTLVVSDYVLGVNAGGGSYTDSTGFAWVPDQRWRSNNPTSFGYVGGGDTRSTNQDIANTEDDPLYRNLREDMDGYRFSGLAEGLYQVELRLADLSSTRAGQRIFDVLIEGAAQQPDVDVFALSGGRRTALDLTYFVEVADGRLDVTFNPDSGDEAIVNAIRVTRLP